MIINTWRNNVFKKYPYISVQFLFAWLIFKILGFLKFFFLLRLVLALTFFFLLLRWWENILPFIINNGFFQAYLFTFYLIINWCINSEYKTFFLSFILSGFFFVVLDPKLMQAEFFGSSFYYVDLSSSFFLLMLINFFKKFNQGIIFKAIENITVVNFPFKYSFCWGSLIVLQHFFFFEDIQQKNEMLQNDKTGSLKQMYSFQKGFAVKNRLPKLEKFRIEIFPISQEFFQFLENIKGDLLNCSTSTGDISGILKDLHLKEQREKNSYLLQLQLNINSFYWTFVKGLILGTLTFFVCCYVISFYIF